MVEGGLNWNRVTEGRPNHLLRAPRPAFVKAWIFDQDGQVVPAPVVPQLGTSGTASEIVPADFAYFSYVFQNAKCREADSGLKSQ
jgi:predicted oxidoreductase